MWGAHDVWPSRLTPSWSPPPPLQGRLHRRSGRQRHDQRPRGHGRRARRAHRVRWCSRRGWPSMICGPSWTTWPGPPPGRVSRSSPATPRWWSGGRPTAATSPPTGIGLVRPESQLDAANVRPTDAVVLSGTMGDHGVAVMVGPRRPGPGGRRGIRPRRRCTVWWPLCWRRCRPPGGCGTRPGGGVASTCNELAAACGLGVELDERAPSGAGRGGRCVRAAGSRSAVHRQRGQDGGRGPRPRTPTRPCGPCGAARRAPGACVVGRITGEHPGLVVVRTGFGGTRIVDMLVGDPLPRIC